MTRRITRRRLMNGLAIGTALGIMACQRREVPTAAPPAPAPAAPAAPPTQAPVVAAPVAAAPTAAAQAAPAATSAPAKVPAPEAAKPAVAAAKPVAAAGTPKRGGSIIAATQNDWVSMDPVYNSGPGTTNHMIFDPLFFLEVDAKGNWVPTPGLVEKWEFSDTAGVLQLRKGVKFHDDSDWNADVLKWNFERWATDPKSRTRSALTGVDLKNPATVMDPYTLKVNLTAPSPALVERLTNHTAYPISKAAFEKMGAEQFNRAPVGTGPFKLVEWKPSDRAVLKRNENYWMMGADGKSLPYLDGITYRLMIEDSVRVVELKSHTVDYTELVQGKDLPAMIADPALQLLEADWCGNTYNVMFNSKAGPFSTNLKLRQAALYAIDRPTLAKVLGQGSGDVMKYMLLKGSPGYDESLPSYSFDLDKAKSLMKESGVAAGVLVKFPIISREVDKLQAEMLKQMWEQIGIRAEIETIERAAWVQKIVTEKGNFDVATLRSGFSAGDPDLLFRTFQWSKANFNVARIEDKKMDDLIDRASGTYDNAERARLYKDALRYNHEMGYYDWLWMQKWNWVSAKKLKGVPPPMTIAWDFRGAWLDS